MRGSTVGTIFASIFAVILAANGAMIWLALRSSPGLVTEHPFERGKSYNQELALAATQDALGWSTAVDWHRGTAEVRVTTRTGAPVEGLAATLTVSRPVEAGQPLKFALAETAPGHYAAPLPLPRRGQWQLEFAARRGTEIISATKRIVVP